MSKLTISVLSIFFVTSLLLQAACSTSGGHGRANYRGGSDFGFNGYYGRSWRGNYPGYIGRGGGGGDVAPAPEPVQLPSIGAPEAGDMSMGLDM